LRFIAFLSTNYPPLFAPTKIPIYEALGAERSIIKASQAAQLHQHTPAAAEVCINNPHFMYYDTTYPILNLVADDTKTPSTKLVPYFPFGGRSGWSGGQEKVEFNQQRLEIFSILIKLPSPQANTPER
jgi:hypothetical protein